MEDSFDSDGFGHLIEDSIESEICLQFRDSSYMLVTSSHYVSESDTQVNLIASSEEDMNNEVNYYSDSNNSFIYQMVSSDTNSVYNTDIEQDFDEAKLEMKCLMKMLKFLYTRYIRSSIV